MARDAGLIVLAHGTFDVLHPGHLAFLEAAKRYGDRLVVSVTSDAWVRKQKGPQRPYFPVADRVAMLAALRVVDEVRISDAPDAVAMIDTVRPAVYCKGAEYATRDPWGRLKVEREAVDSVGGRLVLVEAWPVYSSTAVLKALA